LIKSLLEFGLTRSAIIVLGLAVFCAAGLVAFSRLNIEAYPNPAPVILEITAQAAGLSADRVMYVEAGDELTALAYFEEGLRHGGMAGVVAEIGRLSMTNSRRLQLAAEGSGTLGIAIRRWRRQSDAADFGQPTAAATRWRVSVLPSVPLAAPGIGRARWLVELIRCRAGESADFEVEGCDHEGRLALPAGLADRSVEAGARRIAASRA